MNTLSRRGFLRNAAFPTLAAATLFGLQECIKGDAVGHDIIQAAGSETLVCFVLCLVGFDGRGCAKIFVETGGAQGGNLHTVSFASKMCGRDIHVADLAPMRIAADV